MALIGAIGVLSFWCHLRKKGGKGELMKGGVGKPELTKAAAAHAPDQQWSGIRMALT